MYQKLFAGTYLYLIKVENRGSLTLNSYFAYSTLLALTFFHILFFGGIAVALQKPQLILNVEINIIIALCFFLIGWFFFIRNEKYKKTVAKYKDKKGYTIRFAVFVNALMASVIFIAGSLAILTNVE